MFLFNESGFVSGAGGGTERTVSVSVYSDPRKLAKSAVSPWESDGVEKYHSSTTKRYKFYFWKS